MRGLIILILLSGSFQLLAQSADTLPSAVDTTAAGAPIPAVEEIKVDFQKLLREMADSIRKASGATEAISEVEALREQLDNSIDALEDSLRREDPAKEDIPMVGQFRDSFEKIRKGLSNTLTFGNLASMLLILGFGLGINELLRRWVGPKEAMPHKRRLRRLRWYPLLRFVNWLIVFVLLATLLFQHPDVLWPVLTALAIGLGLAAKDGLVDLLGGLWLIFESPYQIGDRIDAGGHYGEVTRIGIRSTQITTLDDNLVTIPNSAILGAPVANSNAGQTDCMAVVRIWLPLNADLQQVRTIAHEAVITSRYFNFYKSVTILFQDHLGEPAGTILLVKAYVSDAKFEKAFEGDVTETVKRALVKAGVY